MVSKFLLLKVALVRYVYTVNYQTFPYVLAESGKDNKIPFGEPGRQKRKHTYGFDYLHVSE